MRSRKIPSQEEMSQQLKDMKMFKRYKPYCEHEDGELIAVGIECRRPVQIVNGELVGTEIIIYDKNTVMVWTAQTKKANAIANANQFRIRMLTGECELFIPSNRADEFLHGLGARVRKTGSASGAGAMALKKWRESQKGGEASNQ